MNDGGPAFPRAGHHVPEDDWPIGYSEDAQQGMSLRDWFAGQAMKGLIASDDDFGPGSFARRAELAGRQADMQIAERAKAQTDGR